MPFKERELTTPTPRTPSPRIPIPTQDKGFISDRFESSLTELTFFHDCIQGDMKKIKAYDKDDVHSAMSSLKAYKLTQDLVNSCKSEDDQYADTLRFLALINFQLVRNTVEKNLPARATPTKLLAKTTLLQALSGKIHADYKKQLVDHNPPPRRRISSIFKEDENQIFHLELDEETASPDQAPRPR